MPPSALTYLVTFVAVQHPQLSSSDVDKSHPVVESDQLLALVLPAAASFPPFGRMRIVNTTAVCRRPSGLRGKPDSQREWLAAFDDGMRSSTVSSVLRPVYFTPAPNTMRGPRARRVSARPACVVGSRSRPGHFLPPSPPPSRRCRPTRPSSLLSLARDERLCSTCRLGSHLLALGPPARAVAISSRRRARHPPGSRFGPGRLGRPSRPGAASAVLYEEQRRQQQQQQQQHGRRPGPS